MKREYEWPKWEAEQARLRVAIKRKTGTITRKQTRLIDNTTELLRQEVAND